MPAPVPPPPPQPSELETRRAVRLALALCLAFLASFLLYASTVRLDGPLVRYGRTNSTSWTLWKLQQLDEAALRAHEGGRVAWLVGSSILRESFDEAWVNQRLEAEGAPWRVAKFGMNRGAPGLAVGVLRRLPVREGDRIIVNVATDMFKQRWLKSAGLPAWRVSMLLDLDEIWALEDWDTQRKIEESVALPRDFWFYQEDAMAGWLRWLTPPWTRAPKEHKSSIYLTFSKRRVHPDLAQARALGEKSKLYLTPDELDFDSEQFNIKGLKEMQSFAASRGASLTLLDVPGRAEYQVAFLAPEVRQAWLDWRLAQSNLIFFPQLPEDHYYDLTHPNFRGREILSDRLVRWLKDPQRGEPTEVSWTPLDKPVDEPDDVIEDEDPTEEDP